MALVGYALTNRNRLYEGGAFAVIAKGEKFDAKRGSLLSRRRWGRNSRDLSTGGAARFTSREAG